MSFYANPCREYSNMLVKLGVATNKAVSSVVGGITISTGTLVVSLSELYEWMHDTVGFIGLVVGVVVAVYALRCHRQNLKNLKLEEKALKKKLEDDAI